MCVKGEVTESSKIKGKAAGNASRQAEQHHG